MMLASLIMGKQKNETLTQRDDLLERCDLAREGNSERKLA